MSLVVALAGCSAIKLGYNNLAELSYWWLDGYLDFDDSQSPRVREDLARLHAWHRASELPRLAPLLARLEHAAAQDITPEQACALEPELRERLAALREQAEPAIAAHAVLLGPAQLQHLERKYAQNNREYTREWLRPSPQERLDKRVKLVAERAEMVYGPLAEPQRAALRERLQQSAWNPELVLAERRRRQQDTLAVLRQVTGASVSLQEARQAMHDLIDRQLESPDPNWRAYLATMRQEACRHIAALHNGTTAAQREHAARRLRAWQRDLAELAADR